MALAVATCGMSVRYGERWRNIGLLIWMVVMEVSICLTLYVHELFISIIIGTAIVLVIMVFTIELIMKKKTIGTFFVFAVTLFILITTLAAGYLQAQQHKVIIECPITVEDGKVTADLSAFPDEIKGKAKNIIDLDVFEYSQMPNDVYMCEIKITYKCKFNRHPNGFICLCTEESLCDVCKEGATFLELYVIQMFNN